MVGRRAVTAGWRWVDGARDLSRKGAGRITADDEHGVKLRDESAVGLAQWDAIPDFSDRATVGCLEGLVADAWDAPLMFVEPRGGGFESRYYSVRNLLGRVADGYPVEAFVNITALTKVEALVIALENAPRRKVPA